MFCPRCKDEFRPGFTHCGRCDVDLVDELGSAKAQSGEAPPPMPLRLVELCGFFSLDEARTARDDLRREAIRSEIVVREPPGADLAAPAREEYWLRVDQARYREATRIVGEDPGEPEEAQAAFGCSDCGESVAAEESFCPHCGARFDE